MFSLKSKISLTQAALFQNKPVYVQFYITARCNLTCKQCNIIYANSDLKEVSLDEIKIIADNFVKIGVAMVLLTGGEPFARDDLHLIVQAFEIRGIHVRMQTNGFASKERIHQVIEYGGKDISISLDSLTSKTQDFINGGFNKSWNKAIETISYFTEYLPPKNSFASLGCVLMRENLDDIIDVIKFGSKISWYTSLVPIHTTTHDKPMGFRSFDTSQEFKPNEFEKIDSIIEKVRSMKKEGYLLYDSDQYLDDIKRFTKVEETSWREKNNGVCDSPNLYFALLPNGEFAPCCDHRLENKYYAYSDDFVDNFKNKIIYNDTFKKVKSCSGCMYGSYPEMTISMRYLKPKIERFKTFIAKPIKKNWPLKSNEIYNICEKIVVDKAKKSIAQQFKTTNDQ